jgi:hypothetical protein
MAAKEIAERQAGRITEIQNLKIGLRKLADQVNDLRSEIAAGPSLPPLYGAVERIEEAIDFLDGIQRSDL